MELGKDDSMTRVLRLINPTSPTAEDSEIIRETARLASLGALIVFPTDTVYGLMTSGEPNLATERINRVKQRDIVTPVAFLINMTPELGEVLESLKKKLGKNFSKLIPGPLTLILEKSILVTALPEGARAISSKTIGIRVPAYSALNQVISLCGGYLLASSANLTGGKEPSSLSSCAEILSNPLVELAVDGGDTDNQPSAVLEIQGERWSVLRRHLRLSELL